VAYPTVAACYVVLLISSVWHLRRPAATRDVLVSQGCPAWAAAPVAALLGPIEALLGVAGIVTVGRPSSMVPVLAGVLLSLFACWAAVVRSRRPGVECGCGDGDGLMTLGSVARASVLAAGVLVPSQVQLEGLGSLEMLAWAVSAAAWVVLVSCLPGALAASDREMGLA